MFITSTSGATHPHRHIRKEANTNKNKPKSTLILLFILLKLILPTLPPQDTTRLYLIYFTNYHYICCNKIVFIWLSTDWSKLARERAMDKKKPDCSELLYFSCFQTTHYLICKDNISFRKDRIKGPQSHPTNTSQRKSHTIAELTKNQML